MRGIKIFFLSLFCVLSVCQGYAQEQKRHATVQKVTGRVDALSGKNKQWQSVKPGDILGESDVIKTSAKSEASLVIEGPGQETASIQVKERSQLALAELGADEKNGSSKTLLDLAVGKVLLRVDKLRQDKSKFEVKTPTSIVGVRGTVFAVEVENLR